MISTKDQGFVIKADVWKRAHEVIRRSHAGEYIEQINAQYRGAGGRKATAVVPSIEAVLTTGLALTLIGKPASIAGIHRALRELEPDQRIECGFAADGALLAYPAFANWLTRQLEVFDPGADLVARRVLNQDHRQQLATRTPQQREASELARERRDALVNLIVAGSVDDRCPEGYAGDVVADETIIDLAGPSEGLGVRPDKQRAAAYAGAYYMRDKTHQLGTGEKMREVTKRGFGIGVTAVSRVGSADDLYSVSPVITAISIDKPSPGSTVALGRALQMHQANGFAASVKAKANARLPYLCVDMGYSVRPDFTTVVHDHGFAPVMRYPVSRQTVWASEKPEFGSQSPGPVQINGAFYCPAALPLARQRRLVRRLNELLDEQDGFEAHDQALQKLLPLLMGTNSRPLKFVSKRKRSPETIPTYQIDLVCPAVQGRVKCVSGG
ncbi:hypothetical protein [Corynebacterium vitaeruminis]|uniref:hypothetical protein n=1 Tax=Corynebacterium vitaeruminis TaxID=38305 RepID=UPI000AE8BB9C|nr:hypothetical protein [Corynebacterium vitaeruminis]